MSSKRVTITTQEDLLLIGALLQGKAERLQSRSTKAFDSSEKLIEHVNKIQHVSNLINRFDEALVGVIQVDESPKVTNKPVNHKGDSK
jgi:hypothetical protein